MENTGTSSSPSPVKNLVVAVHGIGSQFQYSTVQSVLKQFAKFCHWPVTQPLGAFHSGKLISKPNSAKLGAYELTLPTAVQNALPEGIRTAFKGYAFAEVFWADIPESAAETKNTTEEIKAWAQTVVERVRNLDQLNHQEKPNLIDYEKASAVVAEMIETIKVLENLSFLAKKTGLFEFDLGQLLTDYLGDVQIVADFKDYGGSVFERFRKTMKNLHGRYPELEKIYIVAHSEGTVVAVRSLLLALKDSGENPWIQKVKGLMTIGSPMNKHIVMWPGLWEGLQAPAGLAKGEAIRWRNYYDYGDPVGFDLRITRDWLRDNNWMATGGDYFDFEEGDDFGFTRYPFPGKAHNDYWDDPAVFGHFINDVVLKAPAEKPATKPWAWLASYFIPYILCAALLTGATYVLYRTLFSVLGWSEGYCEMARNVGGISCLLAGITILSRLPRLDKLKWSVPLGLVAFAILAWGYLAFVSENTDAILSSGFPEWVCPSDSQSRIVWVGLAIGIISGGFSKFKPGWGMKPLIGLGGIAATTILYNLVSDDSKHENVKEVALWPLGLADAAFLYLWWLSALIFDLVYIWHRFVKGDGATNTLRAIHQEAKSAQGKADSSMLVTAK